LNSSLQPGTFVQKAVQCTYTNRFFPFSHARLSLSE